MEDEELNLYSDGDMDAYDDDIENTVKADEDNTKQNA